MNDHYFHETPNAPSDPCEIEVDVRGLQFKLVSDRGVFSREHADTGTLLLAKTVEFPESGDILDLGCGYGLLGIVAAALCPQGQVVLVDINERAAELARANCKRLLLRNAEVLTGDARTVLGERRFDLVMCNPPYRAGKALVMGLLEDAAKRLRPGGALWLVGRTKLGIRTLGRDVTPLFDSFEMVRIKGGFRVMVGRRATEP